MASANNKDSISVNCYDIPESFCVETRFITPATAKLKKYQNLVYLTKRNGNLEFIKHDELAGPFSNFKTAISKSTALSVSIQPKSIPKQTANVQQNQMTPASVKPSVTLVSSTPLTNITLPQSVTLSKSQPKLPAVNINNQLVSVAPHPAINDATIASRPNVIDQIQQTDISALTMKSIAIQCKLDEEPDEVEWPSVVEQVPVVNEQGIDIESFLKFAKDNSTQYEKYKECLICGEITKSSKYFYGHMATHRCSKVLCSKCGKFLDESLMSQHKCRQAQQLVKAFLQCPHHNCNVVAISRFELYDHINEHSNDRLYKCSACGKGFCTGQEFLRHIFIRPNCYTSAQSKRFHVYGLASPRDLLCRVRVFALHTFKKRTTLVKTFLSQRVTRSNVCKICLKSYKNKSFFNRHHLKCLAKFRNRLLRQKNREARK